MSLSRLKKTRQASLVEFSMNYGDNSLNPLISFLWPWPASGGGEGAVGARFAPSDPHRSADRPSGTTPGDVMRDAGDDTAGKTGHEGEARTLIGIWQTISIIAQ